METSDAIKRESMTRVMAPGLGFVILRTFHLFYQYFVEMLDLFNPSMLFFRIKKYINVHLIFVFIDL